MIDVLQTDTVARWLTDLRDRRGAARVAERLRRMALGNPGDVRPVGGGVSELRVDQGPGYRVCGGFARRLYQPWRRRLVTASERVHGNVESNRRDRIAA
ncbi:MAG: type II toxin-antitoxin system RelE/ParE family toxin [Caulobacteraceae bacterium]|nr:type II toxin-antitoxin system RelE/ParE family toxin [Caulobacteraceae bacterium]